MSPQYAEGGTAGSRALAAQELQKFRHLGLTTGSARPLVFAAQRGEPAGHDFLLRLTHAPGQLCFGQRADRLAQHVPLCASGGTAECAECAEVFLTASALELVNYRKTDARKLLFSKKRRL